MKNILIGIFVSAGLFGVMACEVEKVSAEDFYLGSAQRGDGSGLSCQTAKPYTFFTTGSNCGDGTGKVSAGDTVYLCDDGGDFTQSLVTPYYCNGFTLKNAPGETPTFDVATDHALNFPNGSKSDIVIDGLNFVNWGDGKSAIYFVEAVGPVEIKNSRFTKNNAVTASFAINFFAANNIKGVVNNVDIHHNYFQLNNKIEAVRMSIFTSNIFSRIHDVNIHHNYFQNVDKAFRFFMSEEARAWVPAHNLRPYNIKFDDNEVHTTNAAAVGTSAGVTEIGGTSSISRNIITNCGASTQEKVNCLQLHWVNGVDINDNVIDGVDSLTCDGDGIILDWTISDDAYISTRNNVLRNKISNANAACGGRCISVFKGRDNLVANNYCNTTSADGLKIGSNEGSGNIFYHNTVINVENCFSLTDGDDIGVPVSIWKNNICTRAGGYGFKVRNNSVYPNESHNILYEVANNDVVLNTTDISLDPRLDRNGVPYAGSPAIDAGVDIGWPYQGMKPDIGVFESAPIIDVAAPDAPRGVLVM